jgi:hypothetical protein
MRMRRWKDTLLIPSIAAVASGILLIAHVISCSLDNPRRDVAEEVEVNEETRSNRFGRKIIQHLHSHGGPVIFGFKIARLIGCLTLFSLSLATLLLRSVDSTYHQLMWDWDKVLLLDNIPQIAMSATFVSHCDKLSICRANEAYSGIPPSLLQFLSFRTRGADL